MIHCSEVNAEVAENEEEEEIEEEEVSGEKSIALAWRPGLYIQLWYRVSWEGGLTRTGSECEMSKFRGFDACSARFRSRNGRLPPMLVSFSPNSSATIN